MQFCSTQIIKLAFSVGARTDNPRVVMKLFDPCAGGKAGARLQPGSIWMRRVPRPATYLSIDELRQIAASQFAEAANLPPGPTRQQLLKKAHSFQTLADMKAWLSSDLRPPA